MHEHGSLPRARQDGLLEETVGEELLLYDQNSHTAHCLSPIAACVWRHCDGERDLAELAVVAGVSEDLVADALHELRDKDLLAAEAELMQSTVAGVSRRDVIIRGARYGAAASAVPLIVSAIAATPAMASSGEEEVIVDEGENLQCKKQTNVPNCCKCYTACVEGKVVGYPTKFQCETFWCNDHGGLESFTESARCVSG
jgi:hypothetical protein